MVTWTTYGTWLQGDHRGYVKNGTVNPGDEVLKKANQKQQKRPAVTLTKKEKQVVRRVILKEAERIGHIITALIVCPRHLHMVTEPCSESIEKIVSRYKNVSMFALRKTGRPGRIWTRGFDKRFCFTKQDLGNRINYVKNHKK